MSFPNKTVVNYFFSITIVCFRLTEMQTKEYWDQRMEYLKEKEKRRLKKLKEKEKKQAKTS